MKVLDFESLKTEKGIKYSRDHVRRLVRAGKFPKPLQLPGGSLSWDEEEIDNMLKARKAARDAGEVIGKERPKPTPPRGRKTKAGEQGSAPASSSAKVE